MVLIKKKVLPNVWYTVIRLHIALYATVIRYSTDKFYTVTSDRGHTSILQSLSHFSVHKMSIMNGNEVGYSCKKSKMYVFL